MKSDVKEITKASREKTKDRRSERTVYFQMFKSTVLVNYVF